MCGRAPRRRRPRSRVRRATRRATAAAERAGRRRTLRGGSWSRRVIEVETIADERDFAALHGEWDALVLAMPRPSPFLLHGWLLAWWRHHGTGALQVHVA